MNENNFIISDIDHLLFNSFTYLGPSHNSCSWLDHAICSNSVDIRSVDFFYDLTFYDHFPILLNLNMDCIQITDMETCDDLKSEFVNWKLFNRDVISRFQTIVDRNLEGLNLCDKIGCNSDHRSQIDSAYRAIVSALKERTAPFTFHQRKKFTPVPGLNQFCRHLHCTARAAFLRWVETGKIRFGEIFEEIKATRRNFIDALNYCKSNRNKIIDMQIAFYFRNKNINDFWKSVRNKKSERNSGGNCVIDGFRD